MPSRLIAFLFVALVLAYLCLRSVVFIPAEPDDQLREKVTEVEVYQGNRSDKWPAVRDAFIKKNPECAACGSRKNLNVHHIKPFHLNPKLELDTNNLITFCRSHHFIIGHNRNWKSENPNCKRDAKKYRQQLEETLLAPLF
jgi:5-methylcytosine-specific restriction endonuclease McrA